MFILSLNQVLYILSVKMDVHPVTESGALYTLTLESTRDQITLCPSGRLLAIWNCATTVLSVGFMLRLGCSSVLWIVYQMDKSVCMPSMKKNNSSTLKASTCSHPATRQ